MRQRTRLRLQRAGWLVLLWAAGVACVLALSGLFKAAMYGLF
ncbi:DUF2474 domain-containing protein [Bordetella sp. 2513F-2]